jgi:hypothetical protein
MVCPRSCDGIRCNFACAELGLGTIEIIYYWPGEWGPAAPEFLMRFWPKTGHDAGSMGDSAHSASP